MNKPQVNLIWAQNAQNYIGKDGGIPWRLSADMARFKELTMGHTVIMGRKTWDSLPEKFRPLPGRKNIVISRDPSPLARACASDVGFTNSFEAALEHVPDGQIAWVIGGKEIYDLAMPLADKIYVTAVDDFTIGDVEAPDASHFKDFDNVESGFFPPDTSQDNFWEVWGRKVPA